MKRKRDSLPIAQHEFLFTPQAFNLFPETTQHGDRSSRERAEAGRARRAAETSWHISPPATPPVPLVVLAPPMAEKAGGTGATGGGSDTGGGGVQAPTRLPSQAASRCTAFGWK